MTVPLVHSNLFTAYHSKEVGQPDHTNDERKTELQAVVSAFVDRYFFARKCFFLQFDIFPFVPRSIHFCTLI